MSSPRRVAITGLGIISPFGRGRAAALDALRNARSGVRLITSIDASALHCRIAGEVPADADDPSIRGVDRFTRFAMLASDEAMHQSGLNASSIDPNRLGVILGTGLGGTETLDASYERLYGRGLTRLPPTVIPLSMYNAAPSAVSARHSARGLAYSVVSACASSAHAIGQAFHAVRYGQSDAVLAGGADAPLVPGIIRAWEGMRVLAVDNEHPERACRPFSSDRKGIVLAEGAAILLLEEWEHARSRGAEIVGEIAGFGITSDAGHLTDPSADGAARAMQMALDDADANHEEVGYINAHGTATKANDVTETRAIRAVFGQHADALAVSSTKSLHGHAMGASGAIEIASSLLALNEGFLPPTINFENRDPECDLDYVPNRARDARIKLFLSNSFGFGGMNGVVAVRTRN